LPQSFKYHEKEFEEFLLNSTWFKVCRNPENEDDYTAEQCENKLQNGCHIQ